MWQLLTFVGLWWVFDSARFIVHCQREKSFHDYSTKVHLSVEFTIHYIPLILATIPLTLVLKELMRTRRLVVPTVRSRVGKQLFSWSWSTRCSQRSPCLSWWWMLLLSITPAWYRSIPCEWRMSPNASTELSTLSYTTSKPKPIARKYAGSSVDKVEAPRACREIENVLGS